MITNIKATNMELTPAIESYLRDKLSYLNKFLGARDEDSAIAEVEIGKETMHHRTGDVFKAEINLSYMGHTYRTVAMESDLYAAIDVMKDEITVQLTAAQKRKNTMIRRGGRAIKEMLRGFGLQS